MDFNEFLNEIKIPEEIKDTITNLDLDLETKEISELINNLTIKEKSKEAFKKLKEALKPDQNNFKLLNCYLKAALLQEEIFQNKNISKDIYIATMKAFTRLLEEDYNLNNAYTFNKGWWLYRFTSGSILRIGELEFEVLKKDNKTFLSIHIPSDSILTPENVEESIIRAKEFFKEIYNLESFQFICDSWLLAPELDNFLEKESNIKKFKELFKIIKTKDSNEFIEFLFRVPEETKFEDLPTQTTLQERVKIHLINGGKISWSLGILNEK